MKEAQQRRAPLSITSGAIALGPLSVEVIPEFGEAVEFALTFAHNTHEVLVLPGRCAIIARRPNGERLRVYVSLSDSSPRSIDLAQALPRSPNEFMRDETRRGEVSRSAWEGGEVKGSIGETIRFLSDRNIVPTHFPDGGLERHMKLRVWPRRNIGSVPTKELPFFEYAPGSAFLKVHIHGDCIAIGLVDERGFGPIVVTPGFRSPLEISFLAEGIASFAAARYLNPSGQRAPIALAHPRDESVSDLLTAIASPTIEHADQVWKQNARSPAANARDFVAGKFNDPVEALVGAHYLLRFIPNELPLRWADNLRDALPDVADGLVIAAWLRFVSTHEDIRALGTSKIASDVTRLLDEAIEKPRALFARTRYLLVEGKRLRSDHRERLRAHAPEDFLNFGAHAGALEAFWGTDPVSPGLTAGTPYETAGVDIAEVVCHGSVFAGAYPFVPSRVISFRKRKKAPAPAEKAVQSPPAAAARAKHTTAPKKVAAKAAAKSKLGKTRKRSRLRSTKRVVRRSKRRTR